MRSRPRPLLALLAVIAAAAAAAAVALGGRAGTPASESRATGRAFTEPFSGARLSRSRWNTCHWWAERGCTIASNNELEWYLPEQVRVRGGHLRLVAERRRVRASDGRTYRYASGMISTGPGYESSRPRFAFRYGRAEIRARVPAGRGLWSAFWLLPADRESKPEIDVMEILGHDPDNVLMHLHPGNGKASLGSEWRGRAIATGWHTFAIDWRPGRLTWLVDGVQRWRVRGDSVPDEPMYLVVNLAVGGDYPGPPAATTPFPSELAVDYVRVRP